MFLTTQEIFTHLYSETVETISGNDETMLTMAIQGAISEAKGYLHKYDVDYIFERTDDDRDPLLLIWLKDIAVWHFINIANPGVDLTIRERRYNAAISWLRGVQKGNIVTDFPVPMKKNGEDENTTPFRFGSNPKRGNHI